MLSVVFLCASLSSANDSKQIQTLVAPALSYRRTAQWQSATASYSLIALPVMACKTNANWRTAGRQSSGTGSLWPSSAGAAGRCRIRRRVCSPWLPKKFFTSACPSRTAAFSGFGAGVLQLVACMRVPAQISACVLGFWACM